MHAALTNMLQARRVHLLAYCRHACCSD